LKTTSSSVEQNENILNEMTRYINERHSSLAIFITDQKKDRISNEIETIESKISFIKAKQLDSSQLKQSQIKDKIAKLKSTLPIIDLEISQLEAVIIEDTNNLSLLKRNELIQTERATNSPTLEQIIFSYKSKINDLNAQKYTNILETKSLNNQFKILENVTLQSETLFSLEQKQKTLENQLIILENDTVQSDELFSLEKKEKTLENELQLLMTQTQTKTLSIGNIETKTIKPKTQLTILLGLIIGIITGIFLVFIRNFVKSYKESQA
jgi:LPS O-antigen subunit length determinant protein (WzzB/FepE family)